MLEKNKEIMWDRNDKEELIPQDLKFEYKDDKGELKKDSFLATILTRVELSNAVLGKSPKGETTNDPDGDILVHCAKNPTFTSEEVKFLKSNCCVAMVDAVLKASGLRKPTLEELKKAMGGKMGKEEKKEN